MDFSFVFDLFSLVHVPTWFGLLFTVLFLFVSSFDLVVFHFCWSVGVRLLCYVQFFSHYYHFTVFFMGVYVSGYFLKLGLDLF